MKEIKILVAYTLASFIVYLGVGMLFDFSAFEKLALTGISIGAYSASYTAYRMRGW